MRGLPNVSRSMTPQKVIRKNRVAANRVSTSTPIEEIAQRVDVGDWVLAQDDDGSLIMHNVVTGNRTILARP